MRLYHYRPPSSSSAILGLLLLVAALLVHAGPASANARAARTERTGILLVAFGSSVPDARASLDRLVDQIHAAIPELETRLAITSDRVRVKLAAEGLHYESPLAALARMADDGFTRVAVQSLHVTQGREYNDLLRTVEAVRGAPDGIRDIAVGPPLLTSVQDTRRLAEGLRRRAALDGSLGEAAVFMGHGTNHAADLTYPALQAAMDADGPGLFISTVEGGMTAEEVVGRLKDRKVTSVTLFPLMTVAGDHAANDMAGPAPDSLRSLLVARGFACKSVISGLADLGEAAAIWTDHLRGALASLGKSEG